MNRDDHQDRLLDMLLSERVGGEALPDVRDRVLARAVMPRPSVLHRPGARLSVKRRSGRVWLAVAALVILMGAVGTLLELRRISDARTPQVVFFSGEVTPSSGRLLNGEELKVGTGSKALLVYDDGTEVEVGAGSLLTVSARTLWDLSKGLELSAGTLHAKVSPQPEGSAMVLGSVHANARVVGTQLRFLVDEERALLEVEEGAVRFKGAGGGSDVLVGARGFAESGKNGFRHGGMEAPGIRAFVLMNSETDQPMRRQPLSDGEVVSLSSLPTTALNIRADYDGAHPSQVNLQLVRADKGPTGLPPHASQPQTHPPFFVAGDHWADGRPEDCSSWTPAPGLYRLSAQAFYRSGGTERSSPPLAITVRFIP